MKTMNIHKLYILQLIIAFIFFSTGLKAQVKSAEERAKDLTNAMTCELGLNKDQVPRVNAINLEAAVKFDEAKQAAKGNNGLLQSKGARISKDRDIELRDVLSPDQFALYQRINKGNKAALKKTASCRVLSMN